MFIAWKRCIVLFSVIAFCGLPSSALAESCEPVDSESLTGMNATPTCELQSTVTDGVTKYSCKDNSCARAGSTKKCVLKVVTENEVVTDRKCLCKTPPVATAEVESKQDLSVSDSSANSVKW
jgi:hypothetical protein